MLWLVIGLLVSLVVLLLAVALMARHIRKHRARAADAGTTKTPETAEEPDIESEP